MKRPVAACLGCVALLAIVASGCLFSSDSEPPPPIDDGGWDPFDTADQLIGAFTIAYTGMDIDGYRTVLSPQYVFIMRPEDVPPGESDRFTCAQELAVAQNMFSGLPIDRGGGILVPGISSISIATLNRQGPWIDVGPDDPDFPNTRRGLYQIQLAFARAGANTIIVNGYQEFYVTSRDTVVNGVPRVHFQLRGQRDLTTGLKSELDSWGSVKRLYR